MLIRSAKVSDVGAINLLIKKHSRQGQLLPRPLVDIYENLQQFVVAQEKKCIIACGALHVSWQDLAEVRSLVVAEKCQGNGIGREMVREIEKRAAELGIKKIFALSFKSDFFKQIGYTEVKKEVLPHKVWRDCINCPLFPNCGETAIIKDIKAQIA